MQLVAVHALFPRFRLAHRLLSEYPNFWLDMTNSISCMRLYEDLKGQPGRPAPIASSLEVDDVRDNYEDFFVFRGFSRAYHVRHRFPVGFGYHPALMDDLRFFDLGREAEECMFLPHRPHPFEPLRPAGPAFRLAGLKHILKSLARNATPATSYGEQTGRWWVDRRLCIGRQAYVMGSVVSHLRRIT